MTDVREAAERMLKAFEMLSEDMNWGASALRAETIREVNEAPGQLRAALAGDGWRDISTAPCAHEQKEVWVWGGTLYPKPRLTVSDREWWTLPAGKGGLPSPPTHWHPLFVPPPPAEHKP